MTARDPELLRALLELEPSFRRQGRVIRLASHRTTVFVGDTHGDLDATKRILERYGTTGATIVFLGDTVDRGPCSRENLLCILDAKRRDFDSIHLLMGNHEAWDVARFTPADFWERLDPTTRSATAAALRALPLAAWHPQGVLALHGALPDVRRLEDIEDIPLGSPAWRDITWGDWSAEETVQRSFARPAYGSESFDSRSRALGVRVLVRSHQPEAPTFLFGDRCLTLFTSHAYGGTTRYVAILPFGRTVRTARDLELEEV